MEGWKGQRSQKRWREREGQREWSEDSRGDGGDRGKMLKTRKHTALLHILHRQHLFSPLVALCLSHMHSFLSNWDLGMKEEPAGTADQERAPVPCHRRAIRSVF